MDEVLSTLVILLSVASSSASLGYWLAKQFERINAELIAIEARLDGLEMGIYGFNELLLKVLEAKGVLS
jgi:hypothetical protein